MLAQLLPPQRAGRLVAWGNSFLVGATSLDLAAQRAQGRDALHRFDGLRGGDDTSLAVALGILSRSGVTGLRLVLPVPGDLAGLPGPAGFNQAALAAGEAVLCVGTPFGLVPGVGAVEPGQSPAGPQVRWLLLPTSGEQLTLPSLADAERELTATIREATAGLAALDVAAAGSGGGDDLARIRAGSVDAALPPGYPPAADHLLTRARRMAALVALAGEDEGSAVSAMAMTARWTELRALAVAARRAIVASYNAVLEPPRPGIGPHDAG